ncbi:hypothetical protein BV20DRAFT_1074990 [Pilatotrama ljubarskyi]|nr:hypothetical protein BV20DRAFT_1074990 [Pilatotrama ljubarskyi]
MGYHRFMGYGVDFPLPQLGRTEILWVITGYGVREVWIRRVSTVLYRTLQTNQACHASHEVRLTEFRGHGSLSGPKSTKRPDYTGAHPRRLQCWPGWPGVGEDCVSTVGQPTFDKLDTVDFRTGSRPPSGQSYWLVEATCSTRHIPRTTRR